MASEDQVRRYLAYWFQLGKPVMINGGRDAMLPKPVIAGDRYSPEFEACWSRLMSPDSGDCYLEATSQTIKELLTPAWDISSCARCQMPVPMLDLGTTSLDCPCINLPNWPDTELPQPRSPVSSSDQLNQIRARLLRSGQRSPISSDRL